MAGTKGRAGAARRKAAGKALLRAALAYPEAAEDHPWGESVVKVKGKIFVFFGVPADRLHVTTKLPESRGLALELPFTEPTGYGLGKAGWVTATFEDGVEPPVPMLLQWIDESYRAVAPKTLVKRLDGAGANAAVTRAAAGKPPRRRR